jgi:probable HAF family extracellular repeat protein
MTLFAALAIPVQLAAQEQQNKKLSHYAVIDLGTVNGGFGAAAGINNRGWVADSSTLAGGNVHAFLWRKGALTDLGTLGGPNSFEYSFEGVNERGKVVGEAETSTPDPNGEDYCMFNTHLICLAFVWQKGTMTALPTLGGNNSVANGVNNRGQIVGQSETPNSDPCSPFFLQVEAVIWLNGQVQELPLFPGDSDGFASAINDKGQAVGYTGCVTGRIHAVLWPNGPNGDVIDLGNFGGTVNFAYDINNRGQVVGQSNLTGDTTNHAFLWQNGVMTDLGTLPGDGASLATNINSKTQVVGPSFDASGNPRAFLWQDGVMTDLNTLIPADSPFSLVEALGINDRGQITGYALVKATGENHGFLATPCDEQHAGDKDCEDGTGSAAPIAGENSERTKTALPESFRQRLQQRPRPGRFGTWPITVSQDHQGGAALDAQTLGGKPASPFVLHEHPLWAPEAGVGKEPRYCGFWAPHCEVGANNRLTGWCKGEKGPACMCTREYKGFPICTRGDKARKPIRNQYSCGLVDGDHTCSL